MWSRSFCNTILPAEASYNQGNKTAKESSYPEFNSISSLSASLPISPNARIAHAGWTKDTSGGDTQFDSLATFCEPTSSTSSHKDQSQTNHTFINQMASDSLSQNSSPRTSTVRSLASLPMGPYESIICGGSDDILFMHYLDQVFYIQYPFYHPCNTQGRAWLFSILRRFKSTYHAALSLSEHHQLSTYCRSCGIASDATCLRTKDGHYDQALREMRLSIGQSHTWSGTPGFINIVGTLTCILQLLFWEVSL